LGVARAARLPINIPKENGGAAALEPDLLLLMRATADFLLGITGFSVRPIL
jgi:hypothetical protein